MRRRVVVVAAGVAVAVAGIAVAPKAYGLFVDRERKPAAGWAASGSMSTGVQPAPPPPTLEAGPVTVTSPGYLSWALLDRQTNEIAGSPNIAATNTTESMIKTWIVSDFLRQRAAANKTPTAAELKSASTAIRDSNDDSAEALFSAGGRTAMLTRLTKACGLTDTKLNTQGWWSLTEMSARDAVRMGACIADGRAAGPQWTNWVLTEMRSVHGGIASQAESSGGGRWGIIDGLPTEVAKTVAIKNGWTAHTGSLVGDNMWHVNCLAIGSDFVLAVQERYPVALGLAHGAGVCRAVTEQLVRNAAAG